jgi:PadR family transcriptional regulator, regulatory protein PadR
VPETLRLPASCSWTASRPSRGWTPRDPYVSILRMAAVRVTVAVAAVLRVFLEDCERSRYGYELMQVTGFPSGKLYPVLARLERAGWLAKEREPVDPVSAGRPARRLYRISEEGIAAASRELALLSEQLRPLGPQVSTTAADGGRP